jgi:hypothetical protein
LTRVLGSPVSVRGDRRQEWHEFFAVRPYSANRGASVLGGYGLVIIVDNDRP